MSNKCYYENDWLIRKDNQTHLIPPILTYVRLHAMCFKVEYPPSLKRQKHCMYTNPFNQQASARFRDRPS